MLLIHCPYCDVERPETEFVCRGEAHLARPADPSSQTDEQWAEYLYLRENPKGLYAERWRHIYGCGRFFNAVRDTVSDKFVCVYKTGEPKPDFEALTRELGA
ncbi:sarcosine oxidase subunit delta [Roseibium algae]|uniref:Sarcosine oxidase subunit delta n=1 Tax=Roseibium algae TaxID=3123038 RepID=A0ABU8TK23_9HYPH